jgi:hypothetical protein
MRTVTLMAQTTGQAGGYALFTDIHQDVSQRERQGRRPGIAGGFAVCGFSATLTKDLYICRRIGLTESVSKRTVIGLWRTAFASKLHNQPRRE